MATSPIGRPAAVTCREISESDRSALIDLLTRAYAPLRGRAFWARAVDHLGGRTPPPGFPRFGYVLESGARLVGALLVIASAPNGDAIRCNVSSWYVEPEFQPYGALLVNRVLARRDATYLNITPAPHTWRLLAAQGCTRHLDGRAVTVPALARPRARVTRISLIDPQRPPPPGLPAVEAQLLLDHARWGCLALLCQTAAEPLPFVFSLRSWRGTVPIAYLIYCRRLDDLTACAAPIGRALLRRGALLLIADSGRPLPSIPGRFLPGYPHFSKGPNPPQPGDLAYTERAVFGV